MKCFLEFCAVYVTAFCLASEKRRSKRNCKIFFSSCRGLGKMIHQQEIKNLFDLQVCIYTCPACSFIYQLNKCTRFVLAKQYSSHNAHARYKLKCSQMFFIGYVFGTFIQNIFAAYYIQNHIFFISAY